MTLGPAGTWPAPVIQFRHPPSEITKFTMLTYFLHVSSLQRQNLNMIWDHETGEQEGTPCKCTQYLEAWIDDQTSRYQFKLAKLRVG